METNGSIKRPVVYLQRIQSFSACHRLHSTKLSDTENLALYDKCNHPNGHGHNYKVEVTLKGPVDPVNGMVCNLTDLKRYIEDAIMSVLDHKNIDKDVPYFKNHVSTMENISVFIWENMKQHLGDLLYEIRVYETDKNISWYRGETTD
ncbi:6-pyruvoyl tetrahydrobiopterin synthase [Plakobranchus ocellatus]|uniref:6-pyruvoyltetrahydropterin synthase n=1 Tax=Plakobranchus ocellatus TaxID=259542 RepID=A0AAV3YGV2_9GAST|nr:6-pyruvoyl tetrahydrobiopterin synthase [Plakobranchus ocellatus]